MLGEPAGRARTTDWTNRNVKSIVDTQEVPMSLIDFFEANEPMLKSPDRIYPGQNLRIPPA